MEDTEAYLVVVGSALIRRRKLLLSFSLNCFRFGESRWLASSRAIWMPSLAKPSHGVVEESSSRVNLPFRHRYFGVSSSSTPVCHSSPSWVCAASVVPPSWLVEGSGDHDLFITIFPHALRPCRSRCSSASRTRYSFMLYHNHNQGCCFFRACR